MLSLTWFLLLALRAMAVTLPSVDAVVPSVIRSDALPEGYTEGPVVWSGFGEYLSGLQGFNGSDKNIDDLQFKGTDIYYQLETLGFPLKPLDMSAFNTKMNAMEIEGRDANPPTQDTSRQCGVGGIDTISAYDLYSGAAYLGSLGDDFKCANMGKSCGRISCNNAHAMEYQCNLFAYYAWQVYYYCSLDNDSDNRRCRGQVTENALHFRTVVGKSADHC